MIQHEPIETLEIVRQFSSNLIIETRYKLRDDIVGPENTLPFLGHVSGRQIPICAFKGVDRAFVQHQEDRAGIGGRDLIFFVNLKLPQVTHALAVFDFAGAKVEP